MKQGRKGGVQSRGEGAGYEAGEKGWGTKQGRGGGV